MNDTTLLFGIFSVSVLVAVFAWITVTELRRMNRRQRLRMQALREQEAAKKASSEAQEGDTEDERQAA